jgi:hypothetical protein
MAENIDECAIVQTYLVSGVPPQVDQVSETGNVGTAT